MERPDRKLNRLENYDYSRNGLYFITICTKDRVPYLSEVTSVGNAALGVPHNSITENCIFDIPNVKLTEYGKIVNTNIQKINEIYRYVSVTKYVIMPDHIHMILFVSDFGDKPLKNGTPGAAFPTKSVSKIINGLKSISTKQIGFSIWQKSFHDHIIRNEKEFLEICDYIDNNPINWVNDIYNQNYWR
jgi:REP element-mobilizing transposase RayT